MRPGDVIDGKYQVEAMLGEGGMGRVIAATHLTLGSTVAIKVLKSEALKYPEVPRRFMREARSAGRLRSEHVVKVMDVGQLATGEPYMVMEMLRGFDLAARIEQGPVPPATAVEYIAQACEGLAEAHSLGMIHRDIKPANLFVTQRPNGAPHVKVLDFGIATAAIGDVDHNLTSTLTVIGSPSYMSPEQLRAARDVDPRSDIWSLGVTLYEMLAGEQPFIGPTLTALTLKIVGEPHESLTNVPPALAAIVDRCLAKERERRFANVAQLAAALAPLFPNGRVAAEMVAGSLHAGVAPTLLGIESGSASYRAAGSGVAATLPVDGSGAGSGVVAASYPADRSAPVRRAASSVPWQGGAPAMRAPALPTTTTDLTAGESAPMRARPRAGRRAAWIVFGAVTAGSIVTAGIVLSQRSTTSAAPAPAAAVGAPPQAEAPTPTPTKPAGEPGAVPTAATEPPVTPTLPATPKEPATEPAPKEPATEPAPKEPATEPAPAKPTPVKPTPVKRPNLKRPVKPDPTKDPTKQPVKDPAKDPAKEPVKEPVKDPAKKPCAPNDPRCGL